MGGIYSGGWQGPVKPTYMSLPDIAPAQQLALATGQPKIPGAPGAKNDTQYNEVGAGEFLVGQQRDYNRIMLGFDVRRKAIRSELEGYFFENPDAMVRSDKDPFVIQKTQELTNLAFQEVDMRANVGMLKENKKRLDADLNAMGTKGTGNNIAIRVDQFGVGFPVLDEYNRPMTGQQWVISQEAMPLFTKESARQGLPASYEQMGVQDYNAKFDDWAIKHIGAANLGKITSEYLSKNLINQSGKVTFAGNPADSVQFLAKMRHSSNIPAINAAAEVAFNEMSPEARTDFMREYWESAFTGELMFPTFEEKKGKIVLKKDKAGKPIIDEAAKSVIDKYRMIGEDPFNPDGTVKDIELTAQDYSNLKRHQEWYMTYRLDRYKNMYAMEDNQIAEMIKVGAKEGGTLATEGPLDFFSRAYYGIGGTPEEGKGVAREMKEKDKSGEDWKYKNSQFQYGVNKYYGSPQDVVDLNNSILNGLKNGQPYTPSLFNRGVGKSFVLSADLVPNDLQKLIDNGAIILRVDPVIMDYFTPIYDPNSLATGPYTDYFFPDDQDHSGGGDTKYIKVWIAAEGDADAGDLIQMRGDPASKLQKSWDTYNPAPTGGIPGVGMAPDGQQDGGFANVSLNSSADLPGEIRKNMGWPKMATWPVWVRVDDLRSMYNSIPFSAKAGAQQIQNDPQGVNIPTVPKIQMNN